SLCHRQQRTAEPRRSTRFRWLASHLLPPGQQRTPGGHGASDVPPRSWPMASQRDIRRRIQSSKNIKQITRAMQFVAASKLKRAQEATLASRPYAEKLDEVLADLASVLSGEDHPLLVRRETGKRLIVLITTD